MAQNSHNMAIFPHFLAFLVTFLVVRTTFMRLTSTERTQRPVTHTGWYCWTIWTIVKHSSGVGGVQNMAIFMAKTRSRWRGCSRLNWPTWKVSSSAQCTVCQNHCSGVQYVPERVRKAWSAFESNWRPGSTKNTQIVHSLTRHVKRPCPFSVPVKYNFAHNCSVDNNSQGNVLCISQLELWKYKSSKQHHQSNEDVSSHYFWRVS